MENNELKEKIDTLLNENKLRENEDLIVSYIPEIRFMIGFEHNHPHHNLDVWNHTLKVLDGVQDEDLELKMAALLHDIGKPFSYQDEEVRHFHGHPEVSKNISEKILKRLNYDEKFINDVCYLIKTHDIIIDVNNLDNSYSMIMKRLKLQYADAMAHNPKYVDKRIQLLDNIKKQLIEKNIER